MAAWEGLGLDPLSPREMRGWLQLRKDLLKQVAELENLRTEQKGIEEKCVLHRQRLTQCLQALGCPPRPPDESLSSLRDRAETELKRFVEIEVKRTGLIESISKLKQQFESAHAQGLVVEQHLEAWRGQWALAIKPLSLAPDVSTEEAAKVVDQATELQSRIKEARDRQRRIAALRQEAAQFASEVSSVCRRVAADLNPDNNSTSWSVELAAGELLQRLHTVQETWTAKQALVKQRESELATSRKAEQSFTEASLQLAALCQEARCARGGRTTRGRAALTRRAAAPRSAQGSRRADPATLCKRTARCVSPGSPGARPGSTARSTSGAGRRDLPARSRSR